MDVDKIMIEADTKRKRCFKVNMTNGTPILLEMSSIEIDRFVESNAAFWSITSENGARIYISSRNIESIEEIIT